MAEKRRTYAVVFNKGIDKSSLPFEASPARALDELNYVYRDGKVQKRFGIRQIVQASNVAYVSLLDYEIKTNSTEFNGIWRFLAEDGQYHTIAHIGKLLFEVNESAGLYSLSPISQYQARPAGTLHYYRYCYEFESYKSTAIIGGQSLYFFGGNRLMRLRYTTEDGRLFVPVDISEDTYVPTTTISITEVGSALESRDSLDAVNMMNELRINTAIGGAIPEEESPFCNHRFTLDAPIISSDDEPLSKIEVVAESPLNPAAEISTYEALDPDSAEIAIAVGEATHASIELVKTDAGGNEFGKDCSIGFGDPTRAETLASDSMVLRVKITLFKYQSTQNQYTTDDGTVSSNIVVVGTRYIDLNDFIAFALAGSTHFLASWGSGASLTAYDKPNSADTLSLAWTQGSLQTSTNISVSVRKMAEYEKATMRCIELDNPKSFTVSGALYGVRKALALTDISALLVDEDDDGSWADSFESEVQPQIGLSYGGLWASYYTHKIYGCVINYGDTTQNGEIILFGDWRALSPTTNNIKIKFPCYVEGNADKINKCHIAKLFGNANAKNRLFVSGNPDFPNCDWHSSARNEYLEQDSGDKSNGDFTYFGDMDYCFYGQTDNAIMGYDNVATDKMVVLKSKSKVEPTNYFRSSNLIQAIGANGSALTGINGQTLYQESFPLATGNIGVGAMNMNSIVNLNGDTLYLSSENTICGLDIAGQVGDSQRISYSRSRYIDPELKELDLSDAVLWTNNVSAYLFASEATYITHYETFDSETGQYEWFKVDVKGARCAIDIDGDLYIGTNSGGLYRAYRNQYVDVETINVNVGGTLYAEDKITYNSAITSQLGEGKNLTFKIKPADLDSSLFRKVAKLVNDDVAFLNQDMYIDATKNVIKIMPKTQGGGIDYNRYRVLVEELAFDGEFYFSNITGDGVLPLETYTPYKLVASETDAGEYKVYDEDGNEIALANVAGAIMCRVLDGEYEITDLDTNASTFKIRENGRAVDVVLYADQDMSILSFPSIISKHSAVKAYFIAAPATLGGVSYRKTIWAWTMTAFREANDLHVCQATNEENLEDMRSMAFADNVPVGLHLTDFSLLNLDFAKSVVPRKYTYYRPLSVPFIAFGFKSDKAVNSILTSTSIVYSIPMLGWGNH